MEKKRKLADITPACVTPSPVLERMMKIAKQATKNVEGGETAAVNCEGQLSASGVRPVFYHVVLSKTHELVVRYSGDGMPIERSVWNAMGQRDGISTFFHPKLYRPAWVANYFEGVLHGAVDIAKGPDCLFESELPSLGLGSSLTSFVTAAEQARISGTWSNGKPSSRVTVRTSDMIIEASYVDQALDILALLLPSGEKVMSGGVLNDALEGFATFRPPSNDDLVNYGIPRQMLAFLPKASKESSLSAYFSRGNIQSLESVSYFNIKWDTRDKADRPLLDLLQSTTMIEKPTSIELHDIKMTLYNFEGPLCSQVPLIARKATIQNGIVEFFSRDDFLGHASLDSIDMDNTYSTIQLHLDTEGIVYPIRVTTDRHGSTSRIEVNKLTVALDTINRVVVKSPLWGDDAKLLFPLANPRSMKATSVWHAMKLPFRLDNMMGEFYRGTKLVFRAEVEAISFVHDVDGSACDAELECSGTVLSSTGSPTCGVFFLGDNARHVTWLSSHILVPSTLPNPQGTGPYASQFIKQKQDLTTKVQGMLHAFPSEHMLQLPLQSSANRLFASSESGKGECVKFAKLMAKNAWPLPILAASRKELPWIDFVSQEHVRHTQSVLVVLNFGIEQLRAAATSNSLHTINPLVLPYDTLIEYLHQSGCDPLDGSQPIVRFTPVRLQTVASLEA